MEAASVNNAMCTDGKTVRTSKENEACDIPRSEQLSAIDLILQGIVPSLILSAALEVKGLNIPYNHLTSVLTFDAIRPGIILELCM